MGQDNTFKSPLPVINPSFILQDFYMILLFLRILGGYANDLLENPVTWSGFKLQWEITKMVHIFRLS